MEGRDRYGWTGVDAGGLDLAGVAALLDALVTDLDASRVEAPRLALAAAG